jgi:hypothetical protein
MAETVKISQFMNKLEWDSYPGMSTRGAHKKFVVAEVELTFIWMKLVEIIHLQSDHGEIG